MPPPEIIGRYEIIGPIGSGGMGSLWRARDPKIGGRTLAIKILKEGIDNEEVRRRFMQEANAAGVLEHENIVRIFDVGEHEGEPFIAMEFIDGETLSAGYDAGSPRPLAPAAQAHRGAVRRSRLRAHLRHRPPRRQAGQPDGRAATRPC